ncbi:hypothetical protein D6C95_01520 [Aureobasidium pullulans]|nr:hypothetical protein D6C95_01520 [Aureobasidium pullulans]
MFVVAIWLLLLVHWNALDEVLHGVLGELLDDPLDEGPGARAKVSKDEGAACNGVDVGVEVVARESECAFGSDDDEDEADTQIRPIPTCDTSALSCKPGAQNAACATPRKTKELATDDRDETESPEAHDTLVLPHPLPRTFRVPPGFDLVTPRSSNKKSAIRPETTPKRSKVVVDFGKDDGEKAPTGSGPRLSQRRPNAAEKHDTALPTPESVKKHTASETRMPRNKKIKTLRISTTRKALESHDESEDDESSFETPVTLATTRKRRRGLDYTASPTDYCYDNADDDDHDFEDVEGDDRRRSSARD